MATTTANPATTPAKAPAKKLDPADLVDKLLSMVETIGWDDRKAEVEVEEAERALAAAKARLNRAAEKKLRILRSATVEEAQRIRDESPADENLKTLCRRLSGWKPLQEKGATDDQVKAVLKGWPEYRQTTVPSAARGWRGDRFEAWVDPDKSANGTAHLAGQKLVEAVRRVMGIPKPVAPKPEPKKPAKAPASHAKKPAPAGGVAHRPLTWGQWAATLRGINGRIDLPAALPDKPKPDERERFFLDQFAKKKRPAEARDAWQRLEQSRPPAGPLPSVAALESPQTPMPTEGNEAPARLEPRSYPDPAEVGATPAELEASMAARKFGPPSPNEPAPLASMVKPLRLRDGHFYAAIRARHYNVHSPFRPVVEYTLRRLYRPEEWQGKQYLTWNGLPGAGKLAPEDVKLGGLVVDDVDDQDGPPWILGDAIEQLHVDVIGAPVARVIETKASPADKPREVVAARRADDAVIAANGTFEQAINAGTAALMKAADEAEESPDAKCRVCGCTEDDCADCIAATGAACRWVDDPIELGDLCSRCRPPEYGRAVAGRTQGGHLVSGVIVGHGLAADDRTPFYQVRLDGHEREVAWVKKESANLGEQTVEELKDAAGVEDPNVDGRGIFVGGVEEVWAWKHARGEIRILVARGADGLWRTGHRVEFVGPDVWQADSEEPVRLAGQATESRAYAVRARANVLLNRLRGGDGAKASGRWTPAQKTTYSAAINALVDFVARNPACRTSPRAAAKAG